MTKMITINSVIGNIKRDKKLQENYTELCQKGLCEKIVINRLESQRVRMRKTTDKGTDAGLSFAPGTVLRNGDVVYQTEAKMIVVELAPENVAVLVFKHDDSDNDLFEVAVRIGHAIGNLHRPIKIVGEKIYLPIQAQTEIELLEKIFAPIHDHLSITQDKIIFETDEGLQTHEH
jgi:urease accessory protein